MPDRYFECDDNVGFFNDETLSKNKCEHLSKKQDIALRWEDSQSSVYSSEVVKDEEEIARLILSPIHIDKDTGDILPTAYDDVFNKGLSVNRLSMHESYSSIHQMGKEKEARDIERDPLRKYLGFTIANVEEIRRCKIETVREFAVYDTALELVPCHADVCAINKSDKTLPPKAAKKQSRLDLKNTFSKFVEKY